VDPLPVLLHGLLTGVGHGLDLGGGGGGADDKVVGQGGEALGLQDLDLLPLFAVQGVGQQHGAFIGCHRQFSFLFCVPAWYCVFLCRRLRPGGVEPAGQVGHCQAAFRLRRLGGCAALNVLGGGNSLPAPCAGAAPAAALRAGGVGGILGAA